MAPLINVTCRPIDSSTKEAVDIGKDDLNALLYIVVTLLFYSMGIIIGIITYLKREQADMEEDQMFDLYLSLKQEPFNVHKQERVRQMAVYLKQMEEAKLAREKIEAWNAEQLQKTLNASADDPPNVPAYETSVSFPGASGSGPETDRPHGASAFLCSLTLGVCEPLLTPDGKISRAVTSGRNPPNSLATSGRIHGQRHSMPSMNTVDSIGKGILRENQRSYHEKRTGTNLSTIGNGFKAGIELQDFRLSTVDTEDKDTNDDSSEEDGFHVHIRNNEASLNIESISNTEHIPAFKRAAFATDMSKQNRTIDTDQMSLIPDSDEPGENDSSVMASNKRLSCAEESVEGKHVPHGIITPHLSVNELSVHSSCDISHTRPKEEVSMTTNQSTPRLVLPSEPVVDIVEKTNTSLEPLTLDQTLQPMTETAESTLKLSTTSLNTIPQDVTNTDISKNETASTRRHLASPRFDSWRKGGAKSADIPDSRIFQPIRRNEKRHERRGALLFTQKSLHHIENESGKGGAGKKGVGREESTDSYSSRTTDSSDLGESPKLPLAHDRSGPGSIAGGAALPAFAARRQERRIPRLVRSKTVDSSKSPPL